MENRNEQPDINCPDWDQHPTALRLTFCRKGTDESDFKLIDGQFHCEGLAIHRRPTPVEDMAPGAADEGGRRPSMHSAEGAGKGSGSTVVVAGGGGGSTTVVQTGAAAPAPADHGIYGNGGVSNAGVDGVVSNVFAKEELIKVDVEPNKRRDLCLESYGCCFLYAGGCSWFFKMPDCLGCGCLVSSLFGSCARSFKLIQKPTFCELAVGFTCIDMSTCCAAKDENDDECCSLYKCSCQTTYCCITQDACKVVVGLMRTLLKFWQWYFCVDCRCACPVSSFAPLQCLCCGFGYRAYGQNPGVGFRMRADTCEDEAPPPPQGGGTTVVVVNQAAVAPAPQ